MNRLLVNACAFCAITATAFAEMRHPAMPLNRADLEFLKANKEKMPWKIGWDILRSQGNAQPTYVPPTPCETVERWPGRSVNNWPWKSSMAAAWNQARMWYFTDDERHAQIAHDIIVGWATTQKVFDGYEACLDIGEHIYYLCGAADILRGCWSGWTEEDTAVVKKWLREVILPATGYTYKTMGPANKGGLEMAGAFGVAIFCDDDKLFHELLDVFVRDRVGCLDGFLPTGQGHEAGRDMGHSYGGLLSTTLICELAWKQGVDLYTMLDSRMLAAGEWYAAQNLGISSDFVSHGNTDGIYATPCDGGWAHGRRAMTWLTTAYRFRLRRRTPWMDVKRVVSYEDADCWCCYLPADRSKAVKHTWRDPQSGGPEDKPRLAELGVSGSSAVRSGDSWTLTCTGGDLWRHPNQNGGDACAFLYVPVTNEHVSISMRVDSMSSGNSRGKVAVMFRSSLERTAAQKAWCAVLPEANETHEMEYFYSGWENMRGGVNWEKGGSAFPDAYPVWLRIEKYGEWVYTSWSPDGTSWTARGCGSYGEFPKTLYFGVAIASGDGSTSTAKISHLSVTGFGGEVAHEAPAAPIALFTGGNATGMTIRWTASAGAESYQVERSTNGGSWRRIGETKALYLSDKETRSAGSKYRIKAVNRYGSSTSHEVDGRYVPDIPIEQIVIGGNDVLYVMPGLTFRTNPLADNSRFVVLAKVSAWKGKTDVVLAKFLEGEMPAASKFTIAGLNGLSSAEIYVDEATRTVRARLSMPGPLTWSGSQTNWDDAGAWTADGESADFASGDSAVLDKTAFPRGARNLTRTVVIRGAETAGDVTVTAPMNNTYEIRGGTVFADSFCVNTGGRVLVGCSLPYGVTTAGDHVFGGGGDLEVGGVEVVEPATGFTVERETNVELMSAVESPTEVYGRLAVNGGQSLESEVWGDGVFALVDGAYSWSSRSLFDGFSGALEVGEGAEFSPSLEGELLDLAQSRLRMAGGTLNLGTGNGAYVQDDVEVAAGTACEIVAENANLGIRGALTGSGSLLVRTTRNRGPQLSGSNEAFSGTCTLSGTDRAPGTGFYGWSSGSASAEWTLPDNFSVWRDGDMTYTIYGVSASDPAISFGTLRQLGEKACIRIGSTRQVRHGVKVEVGARKGGVSVINGRFTVSRVALTKVGDASTLMLGPKFGAVDGSTISVQAGLLGFTLDARGSEVTSLANCQVVMSAESSIRVDASSDSLAQLDATERYPVAVFQSRPGTNRSVLYVDGVPATGDDAKWRVAYSDPDSEGRVTASLAFAPSIMAVDAMGNLFSLPDGWDEDLPEGVFADAPVEGASYTYGQGYALGVFGAEKKALYEPEMSFEVHEGAGGVKIATVRYDAKSARTGDYGIKCHLFRSPSLAPWVESEVAEGSLGEAMQNDAGRSDKMFYMVKLEIRDK